MSSKPRFFQSIAAQAALIIIGLSLASLVVSVFLNRESMRNMALKEVENKATIFLSSMETSVRRLVMEKDTQSLVDMLEERVRLLEDNLKFAIVGVILRDVDGKVIEARRKNPDGTTSGLIDSERPDMPDIHADFQKVIDSGQPLVKRQVKKLRMVEGQPEVRVIEVLYPIAKRQKGELMAVIKLVISVEQTFELLRQEYKRLAVLAILGFTLATLFLVAGILLFIRRKIISPVLSLGDGADRVASGDLSVQLQPKGGNEISRLMQSFNEMVDGLRHREQMRRSLAVAKEVQQSLLPHKTPEIAGLEIAGRSIYCDETGGDYYDFIEFDKAEQDRVGIVIGDVSGHGVSAALLMATTRAFLRQRTALPGTIAAIISDVNAQLARDVADSGSFMSMFYLLIDTAAGSLHWVRAGHDPAILYDPESDTLAELKGSGVALGVDEHFRYEENSRDSLNRGQIVLLGTDGIWEARNRQGEMFGKETICEILRNSSDQGAENILNRITEALAAFQQGAAVEDDVTLIVVKVTSAS